MSLSMTQPDIPVSYVCIYVCVQLYVLHVYVFVYILSLAGVYSCVYTRALTRVQLDFSREQSSNPPMDVGRVNPGYNPGWGGGGGEGGRSHWRRIRVRTLL